MMDDRRFDELLNDALSRAGEPAPFAVNVEARVMKRVTELGPPRRIDVRYFGRWAAAAAVVGAALIGAAAWSGLTFEGIIGALGMTTADLANVAAKLATPVAAIAASLGRVMNALAGSARTVIQPLATLQPVARLLLVAVTAGMLAFTALIVGRDVRRPASEQEPA